MAYIEGETESVERKLGKVRDVKTKFQTCVLCATLHGGLSKEDKEFHCKQPVFHDFSKTSKGFTNSLTLPGHKISITLGTLCSGSEY